MIVKEKELFGSANLGSNPNPVLASHVTWVSHLICTTPPPLCRQPIAGTHVFFLPTLSHEMEKPGCRRRWKNLVFLCP